MKRREFLVAGTGIATLLRARPFARRQGFSGRFEAPAAVVIGIDSAVQLRPLKAAVSGATEVATWLRAEGVDTELLTDAKGPLEFKTVFDAVANAVNNPTTDQVIIYFAGHGFAAGETSSGCSRTRRRIPTS